MTRQLTKEQKKIYIILSFFLVFFLLIIVFIFIPNKKRLQKIDVQVKNKEQEINNIVNLTKGKELSKAVQDLTSELDRIDDNVPLKREEIINILSQTAKDLKIDVKNINFSEKKVLDISVPGYQIEELPISIQLFCEYKSLADYLGIIRNDLPILIKMVKLDVKGKGEGKYGLDVDMQILTYLSKEIKDN